MTTAAHRRPANSTLTRRRRPTRHAALQPRLVVLTWLATRALLVLALLWVAFRTHRSLTTAVTGWDVQHFQTIARFGYADPTNRAFFPGLPLLLKAGLMVGVPMVVTGVIVALVSSGLATWAVYRLGGVAAACLWTLAPMTVFTLVPYTEAPFAAAAFWAWDRALERRWISASILAAIAMTFRVSGIFLLAGLVVLALMQAGRRSTRLALLVLPAGVLAGFVLYLRWLSGSWLAWFHAQQQGWNRGGVHSPLASFRNTWDAAHPAYWPPVQHLVYLMFAAEIVTIVVGMALLVALIIRRDWAELVFVGLQVGVFVTSFWWMSSNRALLLWFPLFTLLGDAATRPIRSPLGSLLRAGVVAVGVVTSALALVGWAWLFFTGNWAS